MVRPELFTSAREAAIGDPARVKVLSVLTIALLACAAVWHGWRKGYVLVPTDALQLVAPWQHEPDYIARNEQLLDQADQFVPWMIYAVERMSSAPGKAAQIPLWNPHSHLGVPFLANGQSAIFYPTILLHLKLPPEWSWTVSAALRLFVAGLGAYVLAGRYGLRGWPRLLPAVAFMLCGFNVVWLNHPHMNVMPLLPWAVLVTELLVERITLWRMVGGAVVFAVQFLGGHPATCIHLLLTCAMVWVIRAVQTSRDRADHAGFGASGDDPDSFRRARRVVSAGVALASVVAFGFAIAALQWLPLIEYANHSGATLERKARLASQRVIEADPRYLIGLVFPYATGFPDGVAPFKMRDVLHMPNTNELAGGFVGTVPFVLALYGAAVFRRVRAVRTWTIVGLVALLIAIRLPIVDHVVRFIPGLNVAQNARLFGVVALALALLAGFGLDGLLSTFRAGLDTPRLRKALKWSAACTVAVALLMTLVLWVGKGRIVDRGNAMAEAQYKQTTEHEHSLQYALDLVPRVHKELMLTGARLLIPATMLALAALLLWRVRPQSRRWRAGALVVLATVDLLAFAIPFNPGAPADTYFPPVAAIDEIQKAQPARVAGTFRTLIPETASAYGISDLRGYDALAPERYYKWWKHPGIGELDPAMQGYPAKLENPEHPAWSLLNFGYVVTGPDHDSPPADRFKPLHQGEDANVYQAVTVRPRAWVVPRAIVSDTIEPVLDRVAKMDFNPDEVVLLDKDVVAEARPLIDERTFANTASAPIGRAATLKPTVTPIPASPARAEEERPEVVRLRVTGANGGYLVLADTYFPGWTATVVNENQNTGHEVPILPAYGVMRAVPLPVSTSGGSQTLRVEFRYRPWSWRIGAMVSMISVCLLLLLTGAAMFTRGGGRTDARGDV